jgi:thiamine-phosphate pyrophosphorylase
MQLYAITDPAYRPGLLDLVEQWAIAGVHFIQLREKDLPAPDLQALARKVRAKIDRKRTKLLINIANPASALLAREAGAEGVHLAGKPTPGAAQSIRHIFPNAIISLPCHTQEDIEVALHGEADLILFSPIFEKGTAAQPHGLEALHQACITAQTIPVFALGGVTAGNAAVCLAAGAAGVAGIRLFAGDDWRSLPAG